jgi:hypothetical protein
MAAFHHTAFAADLVTQSSDEFLHGFASAEGGAGTKVAMENDVNSFIALQPLNRIETRLFHDLFGNVYGRTPMIDRTGSMANSPVGRCMRQIQSGGPRRRADDRTACRRAA